MVDYTSGMNWWIGLSLVPRLFAFFILLAKKASKACSIEGLVYNKCVIVMVSTYKCTYHVSVISYVSLLQIL